MSFYSDIPIGDVRVGGVAGKHLSIDSYSPYLTNSHSDLALIIQVVRKLSDTREVPILGLSRVVLSLLVKNVDRISTFSYAEQQSIRRLLSYMAPQLTALSLHKPNNRTRAQSCYDLCISLGNRIPSLVSNTLVVNLQSLLSQSTHPT